MLGFRCALQVSSWGRGPVQFSAPSPNVIVCAAKGPRPRYPRVWKANRRIGTISKSQKLVDSVKTLSNVKEEVYGALDAFVAWELEFPLITVKKALKILQNQRDWKRIIQVIKWMLSKGQGRTLGTYFTLLNALAEDGRMEEAEKLWTKLFRDNLESMPRVFFEKMIRIYYGQGMHEKIFETFADMEELGIRPTAKIVSMVGEVLVKQGMFEKNEKLKAKYPPPKWEYRYIKGKRVKIPVKQRGEEEVYQSDGGMLNEMQEEERLGPSDAVNDQELSENLEEDPGYVEEKSE